MKSQLHIALVQTDLVWEQPQANRLRLDAKIRSLDPSVDLVVLPELFTTGFTMHPERCAESMSGPSICWMKSLAEELDLALVGSLVIAEAAYCFNRLVFVHPNGQVDCYDKRHAFGLAGEDRVYASGDRKLIVEYLGWRICPLICYDLRFPVWSRNTPPYYDLLLYVANWPQPRIQAWNLLLRARAVENMSYCVGVNRVGIDPNGHVYPGNSLVIDPLGSPITKIFDADEHVITTVVDKTYSEKIRKKLPFLEDQDAFELY